MTTAPTTLIKAFGQRATKSLGQHFLRDSHVLARITEAARLSPETPTLEVGPGPGVLTAQLLATGAPVLALEKDRRAASFLRERLGELIPAGDAAGLEVMEGDALQVDIAQEMEQRWPQRPWVAVSNLPYNVGTAILLRLLELPQPPARLVLMFQREVVLRLVAQPGSRDYGSLSLAVQARCQIRHLFDVPPESFAPPPKVTSAVALLEPALHPALSPELLAFFETTTRAAFAARRKTIRNSLSRNLPREARPHLDSLLASARIEPGDRAEAVDLERYVLLATALRDLLY